MGREEENWLKVVDVCHPEGQLFQILRGISKELLGGSLFVVELMVLKAYGPDD